MRGCRAFTDAEVSLIKERLERPRDRALFVLGLRSGFRVSELLSLKVCDLMQFGEVSDSVTVSRRYMKQKVSSRTVRLHPEAKEAISLLITSEELPGDSYLFRSQKGINRPITRIQAWRVLKDASNELRLKGKVATHSMRKTFASKMYYKLAKDLVKTQKALGHSSINSTVSYLTFWQEEIDDAVMSD